VKLSLDKDEDRFIVLRNLRLPEFLQQAEVEGGKVVGPTPRLF